MSLAFDRLIISPAKTSTLQGFSSFRLLGDSRYTCNQVSGERKRRAEFILRKLNLHRTFAQSFLKH
jgi:hypothetical protein